MSETDPRTDPTYSTKTSFQGNFYPIKFQKCQRLIELLVSRRNVGDFSDFSNQNKIKLKVPISLLSNFPWFTVINSSRPLKVKTYYRQSDMSAVALKWQRSQPWEYGVFYIGRKPNLRF